jgi:hypothetical protein
VISEFALRKLILPNSSMAISRALGARSTNFSAVLDEV